MASAAASARLCVETLNSTASAASKFAAASARLCVETVEKVTRRINGGAAASARLCVETKESWDVLIPTIRQPPPRGCVLKHCRLRETD